VGSSTTRGGQTHVPVERVETAIRLSGSPWQIKTDPENIGRDSDWHNEVQTGATAVFVPGVIQEVFPEYHGLAWFWREFDAPENPHTDGRYLIQFSAVDYLADVWVNGAYLGQHEGAQEPFVLDATEAIRAGADNLLAVRVLNPTHEPIEGISLHEVASGRRDYPKPVDNAYNTGGIIDYVELVVSPVARVEGLHVVPDWETGDVKVTAELHNYSADAVDVTVQVAVTADGAGASDAVTSLGHRIERGSEHVDVLVHVPNHRLWDPDDPFLYRVRVQVQCVDSGSAQACSAPCGFRDFRFEDGCFRLNGRRIHLHGTLYNVPPYPVTMTVPRNEEMLRRDFLLLKMLGYNCVRIHCGAAMPARQLDFADRLGLLVCEEHAGARALTRTPALFERWSASVAQVIRRDRNHPSVVMWSLLNEVYGDDTLFRHAVASLKETIRPLDPIRLVVLNSGGFDRLAWHGSPDGPRIVELGGVPSLQPGASSQFSVLRWECPEAGSYVVEGTFIATATPWTEVGVAEGQTGSYVIANDRVVHTGTRATAALAGVVTDDFRYESDFEVGDTIDFAQSPKGSFEGSALCVRIRSAAGVTFERRPGEHWAKGNPEGPWHYGSYEAGTEPVSGSFRHLASPGEDPAGRGNLSNPGSGTWDAHYADVHWYATFPHTNEVIGGMRSLYADEPAMISEFGACGAVDYPRALRHFEQWGEEQSADAGFYRMQMEQFMGHWDRLRMNECWVRPQDYFIESQRYQAKLMQINFNAWLGHPSAVGFFTSNHIVDAWYHGGGQANYFGELKPTMADACADMLAPVRLCLFLDKTNVYVGDRVRIEVALFNAGVVAAGSYPLRLELVDSEGRRIFDKELKVDIADPNVRPEPPFSQTVLEEEVTVAGPKGTYRVLAAFSRGVAATGGEALLYVDHRSDMPVVESEIVSWGDDIELSEWLDSAGFGIASGDSRPSGREVILVSGPAPDGQVDACNEALARRVHDGAVAIVLTPHLLGHPPEEAKSFIYEGDTVELRWPLFGALNASVVGTRNWWFRMDQFAKVHPFFEGMPAGGLMDQEFYRDLLPMQLLKTEAESECVCGAVQTSVFQWPGSDLLTGPLGFGTALSLHAYGSGLFVINTLRLRENLARVPAAERLLRNMLNFASQQ
jgi:Glycosyl hydrolases family 2, TIM barrel domain/Glycosyl hydrolases family 2/Glycosyl hydrolases family 2, sugar binding domain